MKFVVSGKEMINCINLIEIVAAVVSLLNSNPFNKESLGVDRVVLKRIDELWVDFCMILEKNLYNTNFIQPEDKFTNFLFLIALSPKNYVLTSYPTDQDGPIRNIGEFKRQVKQKIITQQKTATTSVSHYSPDSEGYETEDRMVNQNQGPTFYAEAPYASFILCNKGFALQVLNSLKSRSVLMATATMGYRLHQTFLNLVESPVLNYQVPSNTPKLDKLLVIASPINYFTIKRNLWEKFWAQFSSAFSEMMTKPIIERDRQVGLTNGGSYCLLLCATEENALNLQKQVLPRGNKHFSKLAGGIESGHNFYFHRTPTAQNELSCRIASLQGGAATGLNLPEHSLLMCAADSYKPASLCYKRNDLEAFNSQFLDSFTSLTQACGRVARKTEYEVKFPETPTCRTIFLSGTDQFPGIAEAVVQKQSNLYKEVNLVQLDFLEEWIRRFTRSKITLDFFKFHQNLEDKSFQKDLFEQEISDIADFRFLIFKEILKYI